MFTDEDFQSNSSREEIADEARRERCKRVYPGAWRRWYEIDVIISKRIEQLGRPGNWQDMPKTVQYHRTVINSLCYKVLGLYVEQVARRLHNIVYVEWGHVRDYSRNIVEALGRLPDQGFGIQKLVSPHNMPTPTQDVDDRFLHAWIAVSKHLWDYVDGCNRYHEYIIERAYKSLEQDMHHSQWLAKHAHAIVWHAHKAGVKLDDIADFALEAQCEWLKAVGKIDEKKA